MAIPDMALRDSRQKDGQLCSTGVFFSSLDKAYDTARSLSSIYIISSTILRNKNF